MRLLIKYTTSLLIFLSFYCQSQTHNDDSAKISRLKTHISTLDYISRHTSNSKVYINLGQSYVDSILKIEKEVGGSETYLNGPSLDHTSSRPELKPGCWEISFRHIV